MGVVQSRAGSLDVTGFLPQSIYKLKKACSVEMEAAAARCCSRPREVVDRIFLLVDENGDGTGAER